MSGALAAIWGGFIGLAPHVLHHVGPVAGAALLAGAGGTALFAAIGFVASVPFLLRLYRRFGSWQAPALALAVFAAMFSLSSFVIGPAISGGDEVSTTTERPPAAAAGVQPLLPHVRVRGFRSAHELLLARATLLVEGQTERLALPFAFPARGFDVDRENVAIVECGGKGNLPLFAASVAPPACRSSSCTIGTATNR